MVTMDCLWYWVIIGIIDMGIIGIMIIVMVMVMVMCKVYLFLTFYEMTLQVIYYYYTNY